MKKAGNIIFWVVVVGISLIAIYTFYNKNKSSAEIKQIPETKNEQSVNDSDTKGPKVPEFELKDIEGKTVKLTDFKGKVVVLNFWATWCKYCIQEMPDFEELSKEFEKDGDAVVLAINVQEDLNTVKDYLKASGLSNLNILMDESGEVAVSYGVNGYPNTFIVKKDGTLYKYIPGKTSKEIVRDLVNEIR